MGDFFNSKDLLLDGISKLKSSKIPNPEIDARILLSHAINHQNTIYMHNNISISKKDKKKYFCFLDKRIQGKPVSRILGSRNFWKNNFLINKYTLDPRPDSEVIIDVLTKTCGDSSNHFQVLDLGSGSGCIGLSLIDEIKNSSLLSVDICKQSLEILNKNAHRLNLMNKLHCAQINWFEKNPPLGGLGKIKLAEAPKLPVAEVQSILNDLPKPCPVGVVVDWLIVHVPAELGDTKNLSTIYVAPLEILEELVVL